MSKTVPAKGRVSGLASTLFGSGLAGTGWIEVTSDVDVVAFEIYGDKTSGGVAALPSVQLGTSLALPHFVQSAAWWTGVTVTNSGTSQVSVTLTAFDSNGAQLDSKGFTVAARSKLSGLVEKLLAGAAGKSGWVLVQSSGSVGAIQVYGTKTLSPNQIAAVGAVPESTALRFGSFVSDDEWWTGLALVNPSASATATLSLKAYAQDGTLVNTAPQSLGPRKKLVGFASSLFTLGTCAKGWIEVTSDVAITGIEMLSANDALDQAFGLAAVETQSAGTTLYFPHHVVNSRWWTVLSMANTNQSTAASVTLNAYDDAGTPQASSVKPIPSRGSLSDHVKVLLGLATGHD